jgi:hypothetical protein
MTFLSLSRKILNLSNVQIRIVLDTFLKIKLLTQNVINAKNLTVTDVTN